MPPFTSQTTPCMTFFPSANVQLAFPKPVALLNQSTPSLKLRDMKRPKWIRALHLMNACLGITFGLLAYDMYGFQNGAIHPASDDSFLAERLNDASNQTRTVSKIPVFEIGSCLN